MDIKQNHVAVAYDNSGNCEFVAKVKVINDKELNRLLNEQEQRKTRELAKNEELKAKVISNEENIRKLAKRDFLLAKSIYDNFVDRGLLNDNDKFQQDFYDFIFNDIELVVEDTPNDFQIILRKVGNL